MSRSHEHIGAVTARIPLLDCKDMSPEQRALHDEIVSGPRGRLVGPLRAAIHSPEMATLWSRLGEFLRYRTSLPMRIKELAIIATARRWNSQVEWEIHARAALEAGLAADIVQAILTGAPVPFSDPDERDVYEYCCELQTTGTVSARLHRAITQRWGVPGVVELTAVIGYYTMVAMTLNAHDMPLPDGGEAPLPPQDGLFSLGVARDVVPAK
jgi:4-carboxymuconolactone decarboxylase